MARGETIRAKDLRRRALVALRAARSAGYDGWLSERAIFNLVRTEIDGLAFLEVREAVAYLEGKGYVAKRLRRDSKFERGETDAMILPAGIDLLEETVPPDPGIEDGRE